MTQRPPQLPDRSRRQFLKHTTATAAAAGFAVAAGQQRGEYTPLVAMSFASAWWMWRTRDGSGGTGVACGLGCGWRQWRTLFSDRIELSLAALAKQEDIAQKIDVPADRQFSGADGYKRLIDSGVDVILPASPPHFRPAHLEAAVDAGLHVFAEKPVAVDARRAAGTRHFRTGCSERIVARLGIMPALLNGFSRNGTTDPGRANRPSDCALRERLSRHAVVQGTAAGLDRNAQSDAELVLLHLALR